MSSQIKIICGHYGCGKTNLTLNLACDTAKKGERVTVVDLDIVNPYFRTTDYSKQLSGLGITVISPTLAGTTLDSPSLSAGIFSAFDGEGTVFFDVGGDDVGAGALGRFARKVLAMPSYELLYVINRNRPVTAEAEGAVRILGEIEAACGLRATAIVNNTHLCGYTDVNTVLAGAEYANEVAALAGLPLKYNVIPRGLCSELSGRVEKPYPVEVMVKLPFDGE